MNKTILFEQQMCHVSSIFFPGRLTLFEVTLFNQMYQSSFRRIPGRLRLGWEAW